MANRGEIVAIPRSVSFTEKDGYVLKVKITDSPQHLIDRIIRVKITSEQLLAIKEWNDIDCPVRELEPVAMRQQDAAREHIWREDGE